jgi:hypothetical protein
MQVGRLAFGQGNKDDRKAHQQRRAASGRTLRHADGASVPADDRFRRGGRTALPLTTPIQSAFNMHLERATALYLFIAQKPGGAPSA